MEPIIYVAGLVFCDNHVLLIRKNRPNWMNGKLNGIGGHIELGENPIDAMKREFTEETGLTSPNWTPFAILTGSVADKAKLNWSVYWFTTTIPNKETFKPKLTTDEPVHWYNLGRVDYHPIVPNLRWLIHMALERISNTNIVRRYQIIEEY